MRTFTAVPSALVGAGAVLFLGACAVTPETVVSKDSSLEDGTVRLECTSLVCAARWQRAQREIRGYEAAQDWESMARLVTDTQYGSDLAYYYLGRAAEEMHHYSAAQRYFDEAVDTTVRCDTTIISACNGVDLPLAARERLDANASLLVLTDMELTEAQRRLAVLGLYKVAIDGIWGPRTRAALRQLQTTHGIPVSGQLDTLTTQVLARTTDTLIAMKAPRVVLSSSRAANPAAKAPQTLESPAKPAPREFVKPAVSVPPEAVGVIGEKKPVLEQPAPAHDPETSEVVASAGAAPVAPSDPLTANVAADVTKSRVVIELELLSDADPFADVVGVVEAGTWVDVSDRGEEWSKVSHQDVTGFVYTDFLQ